MTTIKTLFGLLGITTALAIHQVQAQSLFTDNLVAYYPFNGNANDATSYQNNPITNTATLSTNRFGEPSCAYNFFPPEFINYSNAPQLAFPAQMSLSVFAWIKYNQPESPNFYGIVSKMFNDTNVTSGFQIGIFDSVLQGQIGSPPAVIFQGTTALNDDKWHAVGLVLNRTNSTAQVFVDGNLDGTIIDSNLLQNLSCPDDLLIGVERNRVNFFTGTIDDVRIYDVAFSSNEVQQLYQYESTPQVTLLQALIPSFSNLSLGTNYQLQVSPDLSTWTNSGSAFAATNSTMLYPQYFLVSNWNQLYFRLQASP